MKHPIKSDEELDNSTLATNATLAHAKAEIRQGSTGRPISLKAILLRWFLLAVQEPAGKVPAWHGLFIVGIPSGRVFPLDLWMWMRLRGCGR